MWALPLCLITALLFSCAKMGQPDGGWYDETPPRIIRTSPTDKSTGINSHKINIYFDEFIKLDNPQEKIVICPPQLETPEIKGAGKQIKIELKDSLRPNTTYTIDFSDAISDNNEGNPMSNYTYSFSTGGEIDTLEVSGHVLEAENLEPIKGILVGLYSNLSDSAFRTEPMLRVGRTDSRGHFVIRGIAPGEYRIYALQDADADFRLTQKSEKLAFNHDIVTPWSKPDVRQDTLWLDSLRIKDIARIDYTHFMPDNIVLRAFTEIQTDRYLIKTERKEADHFSVFFSNGSDQLPRLRGLNFDERNAFVTESSRNKDSLTYWIKDSLLINQDTLNVEMQYMATDTLGVLRLQTDTLEILSRDTHEKRMKRQQKIYDEWKKKQDKAKKRGEPFLTEMPAEALKPTYNISSMLDPDRNPSIEFDKPLLLADTGMVHLYSKIDTVWYRAPLVVKRREGTQRIIDILGEWRPGTEYSLEIDSAAFTDIYNRVSAPFKQGFKVRSNDEYSTVIMNIGKMEDTTLVVQLLDGSDNVVKQVSTNSGTAEFFYVKPGTYYMRMFVDTNRNGIWDTGNYSENRQAETVFYYPEKINCKAKWDLPLSWQPTATPTEKQKPAEIVKQKPDKDRKIKNRNMERARKMGIEYIPKI
nr:Ig-like domain-containing protein [Prevotella sp. OH937_COT-195]